MKIEREIALGVVILCLSLGVLPTASAEEHRSPAVAREFQQEHPCPSTGQTSGACPGYIKDHIKPLACGGPDERANIQWQTVADAKAKDKRELKDCARDEFAGYQKGHPDGHDPNGIVLRGSSNVLRQQLLDREHPNYGILGFCVHEFQEAHVLPAKSARAWPRCGEMRGDAKAWQVEA